MVLRRDEMTDAPTLTGQDIGQAERATRAVLDALLADTGTPFEQWVALRLLEAGPAGRSSVVERMVDGFKISAGQATVTVGELEHDGLVTRNGAPAVLELTATGRSRHRRISAGVATITDRLYGDLPVEDLVTARRVLATITQRANQELARSGS
jgi:hypothetical protein